MAELVAYLQELFRMGDVVAATPSLRLPFAQPTLPNLRGALVLPWSVRMEMG